MKWIKARFPINASKASKFKLTIKALKFAILPARTLIGMETMIAPGIARRT